jgi:hypothetical protein
MPTNLHPIARPRRPGIHDNQWAEAVTLWREIRSWSGKHVHPAGRPPYPGRKFDSANREDVARMRQYRVDQAAWEAEWAKCPACAPQTRLHQQLLEILGVALKPWQRGITDFPEIVAELDRSLDP